MRDKLSEIKSVKREIEEFQRSIRAKEFAIELLEQQMMIAQAKILLGSDTFRTQAEMFSKKRAGFKPAPNFDSDGQSLAA